MNIIDEWKNKLVENEEKNGLKLALTDSSNLNYAFDIMNLINDNKVNIYDVIKNAYMHEAGFYRVELFKGKYSAMIHYFLPKKNKLITNIHSHGFDSGSTILEGKLKEKQFLLSLVSDEEFFWNIDEDLIRSFENLEFNFNELLKSGLININGVNAFFNMCKKDKNIFKIVNDGLNSILTGEISEPNDPYTMFFCYNVLGVSPSEVSSYFRHFNVIDKTVNEIGKYGLKIKENNTYSSFDSYFIPNDNAHTVEISEPTMTLFLTKKNNSIPGGHFKNIGIFPDVYESNNRIKLNDNEIYYLFSKAMENIKKFKITNNLKQHG